MRNLSEARTRGLWTRYEVRLVVLFLLLQLVYLALAKFVIAPTRYYGTEEQASFADPWIERTEALLNGKLLYRDVFTSTPPITNYLMVLPALVSKLFAYKNPWATLPFMLYFSFFNLLAAFALLYSSQTREDGWRAGAAFLLNPLTFGNAVLRRQDEAIITFFFALSLLFLIKHQHVKAAISIGGTILVKLWGALLLPLAYLHTRHWIYIVLPLLVFAAVFSPYMIQAGKDAFFWDLHKVNTEHPFQIDGISLGALWVRWKEMPMDNLLTAYSAIFILGVVTACGLVVWKRFGLLQDLSILLTVVLLLSPRLHAGYFTLLALSMAPLLKSYNLTATYMSLGLLVIVADFYKFPIQNYSVSMTLMAIVSVLLIFTLLRLCQQPSHSYSEKLNKLPKWLHAPPYHFR